MASTATVTSSDGKATVTILIKEDSGGGYVIAISEVGVPGHVVVSVDGAAVWAKGSKF